MSEMFIGNVSALELRYPELAARIRAHNPSPLFQKVASPSGIADLLHLDNGKLQTIYGTPAPLEDAKGYWRSKRLRNPSMMIFLGLDLGYHLAVYWMNPNPNTQAYLLVERDLDLFWHLLHTVDLSPLIANDRVYLFVGLTPKDFHRNLRAVLDDRGLFTWFKAAQVESSPYSFRATPDYYRSFLAEFRDAVRDLIYVTGNDPRDTAIGIRNTLLNLGVIARTPGVGDLFGKFAGRPAVIVATGPSLDKNYRMLSELQDRAVILSVDASLKFLLRNGVRPHFVTSLERVPETVPFYEGIDPDLCRDTVQVTTPVVVPEVYSCYPGPKALLYRTLPHFRLLGLEKGTLFTGHSSANMAFSLAAAMGCDPIVLVGQDLSYGEDGATHSSAAYWGRTLLEISREKSGAFPVPGNVTETVYTNKIWNTFRLCYERDVAEFPGTVINATEGGARIEGARTMRLREAIDQFIGAPFAPAERIRGELTMPLEEDALAVLEDLRSSRLPAIAQELESERLSLLEHADRAKRHLEPGADPREIPQCLLEVMEAYARIYQESTVLRDAVGQVVQTSLMHVWIDHYDLPNRLANPEEINRARLELHLEHLGQIERLMAKLRDLYLDPLNTLP